MSKDWNEHKYCNSENLWSWIDDQARRLDIQLNDSKYYNAENVSTLLMGRKEMLDWLGDWLHQNETTLGLIAETWSLKEEK